MNQPSQSAPEIDILVDIRDIYFTYGDRPILKGITLPIRRGKVTAIMATNGDPVEFGQPLFVIE